MKLSSASADLVLKTIILAFALCLIELVALLNALPRMNDAIWQDEAVTLMYSSTQGMIHPFINYSSPNNHIFFSSMMAGWLALFPNGVDIFTLRLLPLSLFLTAVPITFFAAHRLGGPVCAILASLMFASSTVTANFATQLRGYGPSWPFFALMLLCAMNALGPRFVAWRIGYFLSCVAAVAILPSNFFLCLAIGVSVSLHFLLQAKHRNANSATGITVLLASPFLSLIAYAAVWEDLLRYSEMDFSPWTRMGLVQNWLYATISDFLFILPLLVAGLLVGGYQLVLSWRDKEENISTGFVLALLLLSAFAAVLIAMPKVPFPRTLVPFLPIWFCVLSFLAVHTIRQLIQRRNVVLYLCVAGCASLCILLNLPLQACRSETSAKGSLDYDLCYQYFHDGYDPNKVVAVWKMLGRTDVPVVAEYEGYYAIRVLNAADEGLNIYEYRTFEKSDGPNPLIVVHDHADLLRITNYLGLNASSYREVSDTGYFSVYAQSNYGADK